MKPGRLWIRTAVLAAGGAALLLASGDHVSADPMRVQGSNLAPFDM